MKVSNEFLKYSVIFALPALWALTGFKLKNVLLRRIFTEILENLSILGTQYAPALYKKTFENLLEKNIFLELKMKDKLNKLLRKL